jgi:hypothetical protein
VKSKWKKPLVDWIMATGVGFLWPKNCDLEAEGVEESVRALGEITSAVGIRNINYVIYIMARE